ncbi:tetratricopeptide repeat protein [Bradyrhizobium sp.]|uniref:tetratricopeptide repeat protein n=1 Tax=Bradyrhizobium sp. TaxID=376 RepID=UPI0039E450DD
MALAAYIDDALHSLFDGGVRGRTSHELVKGADKARDRKDWARAAKGYAEAISSGKVNPGVRVQLGHALKEMGDFEGAEAAYREFLADHPDDADIHLQLGHLFNRKGDLRTAATFYERACALSPGDTDIAHHAANARRNAGRTEVLRRREAAMACVAERKWEEARQLLRSLVALDGEKDLIGVLANVTKETGRLDEAEALYGGYLRYATNRSQLDLMADCHMQLGHLNKIKGDLGAALVNFLNARKARRASGDDDLETSEVQREILACLREIYPCFVFQG